MIRINGFPLVQMMFNLGALVRTITGPPPGSDSEIRKVATDVITNLQFAVSPDSFLPHDSKVQSEMIRSLIDPMVNGSEKNSAISESQKNLLGASVFQLWTVLTIDLARFDLYLISPKLGFNTAELLADGTVVFPKAIRDALSPRIKHEVQEAAKCLEYEVHSAVGFHILRAIELAILDYFTLAEWSGEKPRTWSEYSRDLKKLKVHPKIRGMINRLAELHRNELMHADAVLSAPEASMLFALMQEVMPLVIADVAKRKGSPIADFPILDDPRWQ
jgi:hypothetical protein